MSRKGRKCLEFHEFHLMSVVEFPHISHEDVNLLLIKCVCKTSHRSKFFIDTTTTRFSPLCEIDIFIFHRGAKLQTQSCEKTRRLIILNIYWFSSCIRYVIQPSDHGGMLNLDFSQPLLSQAAPSPLCIMKQKWKNVRGKSFFIMSSFFPLTISIWGWSEISIHE